jgi:hypothetical protein
MKKKVYFTDKKVCKGEIFKDTPICNHAPVPVHTEFRPHNRPTPDPSPKPDPSPTPTPDPPYRPRPRRDITDLPEDPPEPPEPPRPPPPRRKNLNDASLTTGDIVGITAGTIAGAGALAYGTSVATGSAEVAEGVSEIEMMEAGSAGLSEAEFASLYGGASATGLETATAVEAGVGALETATAVEAGVGALEIAGIGAETAVLGTSMALAPETMGLSLVVGGLIAGSMAIGGLFKPHHTHKASPPPEQTTVSDAGKAIVERFAESDREQAELASQDVMDEEGGGFTRAGKHYVEVP